MKRPNSALLVLLIFVFLIPPGHLLAATMQNKDLQNHQLEIRAGGQFYEYTIYEQSKILGICNDGCEMVLVTTGQTVRVGPDDFVVIVDSVLQVMPGDGR